MKNLFVSIIALSFVVLACKKRETENTTVTDSANTPGNYSDTAASTSPISKDSTAGGDSINTKTHIGGRKTSNNNTGNATGNINAAVSDSAHPAKSK
ncbi:hypothetical protein MP478_00925 [Chryseobacterium sp. WG14]|uniref:hypothetical protein n=1 Tax=unclassified Chryseobacterium TaxID=2593645 RepID=UPI00211DC3F5|nr:MULTISPECIES: hypothetical protein [unclassified Chryseobacterium]MCQ9635676.1 hypothetical protein [Chryseobacterium sp. WG23]MCQ9637934.1 hypothetical protein [Chryseobacterium sp. WG14]